MKRSILILFITFIYFTVVAQVEISADSADSARTAGNYCENRAQYRQAWQYYKLWLAGDTLNTGALNAVGRTALQLGRIQEARESYLKAYALDSTNFDAGLQLAKLHFQLKEYDSSLAFYERLLEQDSTNISFLKGAGDCLEKMGNTLTAINYYSAAVGLNKENASLAITLINIWLNLYHSIPGETGQFLDIAMDICDTALVYNPCHNNLLQAKGVIYFTDSNYPAADSTLSMLVNSGDSSAVNMRYIGMAKYRQDLYYDAVPYFEKLYADDTTNVETIMLLATCLSQTYDRGKALQLLNKAEKLLYPSDEELYNLALTRANTYIANDDTLNARKYYWEAYKLSKKNKSAMLARLAPLYQFRGRTIASLSREEYEQGLFVHVHYLRDPQVRKRLVTQIKRGSLVFTASQAILQDYVEDMFLKDTGRQRMASPDGDVSWVTPDELTRLIKLQ